MSTEITDNVSAERAVPAAARSKCFAILNPIFSEELKMEFSAHTVSKAFQRELQFVFPPVALDNVIVIPTMQCSKEDLVRIGEEVENEKDRLLEKFMDIAKSLCEEFMALGYWADYIDPCSGLPMITPDCNKVFNEVASAQQLLSYSIMNAGCCKILLHPLWGSAVYPATFFTNAPSEVVVSRLSKLGRPRI